MVKKLEDKSCQSNFDKRSSDFVFFLSYLITTVFELFFLDRSFDLPILFTKKQCTKELNLSFGTVHTHFSFSLINFKDHNVKCLGVTPLAKSCFSRVIGPPKKDRKKVSRYDI